VGAIVLALAVAVAVGGCGGGSSSSASEGEGQSDKIEASKPGESEPSRTFLAKSKKNIPKFGEEASAAEREAASKVLEENLKAREAGDWAAQCASLTPSAVKQVEEGAAAQGVKKGSCAEELKGRAEPLQQTKGLRENTMTGPIDALRFKGRLAYALYHGTRGVDYAMQMEKVDGEWKVGSLLTQEP
jgi:hypothetical protein